MGLRFAGETRELLVGKAERFDGAYRGGIQGKAICRDVPFRINDAG